MERELAREIEAHLTVIQAEFERRGMPAEEARLAARRTFGGIDQAKESHRDARSFRWLDDARRDVQYAVRTLVRTPGFTTVAVLTLALGIGANTTMFGVVNGVLLEPLPFKDADRLVQIVENVPASESVSGRPERRPAMHFEDLAEWRARTQTLSGIAVYSSTSMTWTRGEEPLDGQVHGSRRRSFRSWARAHTSDGSSTRVRSGTGQPE